MTDYGVFANIVAAAGCLTAAAGAIGFSWLKRAKWQPPEEIVPAAVSRLTGLLSSVAIACLYVFGRSWGAPVLGIMAATLAFIAVVALYISIRTNVKYSFYYPLPAIEKNRILGGSKLTQEARKIQENEGFSEQVLLEHLQGARDSLWTKDSQGEVQAASAIGYILLIACGTTAIAASALLVVLFAFQPAAH